MTRSARPRPPLRERIAQTFTQVEDVLYVGLDAGRGRPGPARERGPFGSLMDKGVEAFRYATIELGLLTVMTGVLVACLVGLRKRDKEAVAERA